MELWEKQARQWSYLGPPLRPSTEDIQIKLDWIKEHGHRGAPPLSVLLLGVTPELVHIPWPSNTLFFAVDNTISMIQGVLPSLTPSIKPLPVAGNWLQLPFSNASMDIILGDGCYNVLAVNDYARLCQEIQRVLKPDGIFLIRFFTRPEMNETIQSIQEALQSGKIRNFHILKMRLAMALHGSLTQGVCLKTVWECWDVNFRKLIRPFSEKFEWSENIVGTIDNYKNADTYYTFPTLQEARFLVMDYFKETAFHTPNYDLGDRCPSFRLTPKSGHPL